MAFEVRDIDGQRSVEVDARGGSIFMSGHGFCYEFDRGIVLNAMRREFGLMAQQGVRMFSNDALRTSREERELMAMAPTVPISIIRPDAAVA